MTDVRSGRCGVSPLLSGLPYCADTAALLRPWTRVPLHAVGRPSPTKSRPSVRSRQPKRMSRRGVVERRPSNQEGDLKHGRPIGVEHPADSFMATSYAGGRWCLGLRDVAEKGSGRQAVVGAPFVGDGEDLLLGGE